MIKCGIFLLSPLDWNNWWDRPGWSRNLRRKNRKYVDTPFGKVSIYGDILAFSFSVLAWFFGCKKKSLIAFVLAAQGCSAPGGEARSSANWDGVPRDALYLTTKNIAFKYIQKFLNYIPRSQMLISTQELYPLDQCIQISF